MIQSGDTETEEDMQQGTGEIKTTDILLVTGKRGTGKTFFVKWYILEHLHKKVKVFIYDPLWQYGELSVRKEQIKVQHDFKQFTEEDWKDVEKILVFQPYDTQDTEEGFDNIAERIYQKGSCVFVGEEINEYMTPYKITPNFRAMLRRGRNYGIGLVAVTHRPAYLSMNFLNFIDHWFIFQQDLKPDLERLVQYLERANEEMTADFIATMPDRHFIHLSRDRQTGKAIAQASSPVKSTKNIETEPSEDKPPQDLTKKDEENENEKKYSFW